MKKIAILSIVTMAVVAMTSACKSNSAENANAEQPKEAEQAAAVACLTPESMVELVDADWDSVPQALLDTMGIKVLNSFKQEVKDAQVDNLQYYYGKGASVELDKEGQPVKIAADDENAIVIHLTAESVAYGTIAFCNEADYNDFMKKAEDFKASKKADEEQPMEFEGKGKNAQGDEPGYEKDKWFFVVFTSNK